MCKHPLKVKSPKLAASTFIPGADKEFLVVPCGHCEECNHKKVNDLVFRAYYEYMSCNSVGGFVLFQTLTYSEDNVPFAGGFRFFKKSDLQKFFKRLRKSLSDDGYNVDGNMKYLVTCEYGSKHFRPHYHPLFFVKFDISPAKFDAYVKKCWSTLGNRYVRGSYIGIVDSSDVGTRVVNSIYALQYVCKYIYKGTSVVKALKRYAWTDIGTFVHDYCFDTNGRIMYKDLEDWQLVEIWRSWLFKHPEYEDLQLMPFYLQSKGLGMEFLEQCAYEDLFDIVKLPSKSPTGFANFSIPMYYIRKVFYSYNNDTKRYVLNDNGKEYKIHIQQNIAESYENLVEDNCILVDDIFKRLFNSLDKVLDYTYTSFDDFLDKFFKLHNTNLQNFIDYVLYLKDRRISPVHYWLIPKNSCDLIGYLHEFCQIVNNDTLSQEVADMPMFVYNKDVYLFDGLGVKDESVHPARSREGITPLYNDLPVFKNYDMLYTIMQSIKVEFDKAKCFKLRKEYEDLQNQKLALRDVQPYNAVYY